MVKFIRWFLGKIILTLDWLTTPRGIKRAPEAQRDVDAQTANMVLYQFKACPFCVKVRRVMKRKSLTIETRDAKRDEVARQQLLEGGGEVKVPCLRIVDDNQNIQWLYESSDIVKYLDSRFAA